MALNTNKREGDKLHAEEWNELAQEVQGKQPRLNIVDALDSTSSVDVLSAKQGKILNNKIEDTKAIAQDVEAIVKTLPVGYFYGTFTTEEGLPSEISEKGYAYVGTAPDYVIYTYEPTIGWRATENKYSTPTLETNLETKSQTKAPTTKAVQEGIEAIDVTLARSAEDENELTAAQKYNASANINDRGADVVPVTNEIKAFGYKVLKAPVADVITTSFAEQIKDRTNTIFEIRDEFDLNNGTVNIPANCTLKFNGGKLKNGTINFGAVTNLPTVIIEANYKVFENISFITDDRIKNNTIHLSWFANDGEDCTSGIEAMMTLKSEDYFFDLYKMYLSHPIVIEKNGRMSMRGFDVRNRLADANSFVSNASCIRPSENWNSDGYDRDALFIFKTVSQSSTSGIRGIEFAGSKSGSTSVPRVGYALYFKYIVERGNISKCLFHHFYLSAIVLGGAVEVCNIDNNEIKSCGCAIMVIRDEYINEHNLIAIGNDTAGAPNLVRIFNNYCGRLNYGIICNRGSDTQIYENSLSVTSCYAIYAENAKLLNINRNYFERSANGQFWVQKDVQVAYDINVTSLASFLANEHVGETGAVSAGETEVTYKKDWGMNMWGVTTYTKDTETVQHVRPVIYVHGAEYSACVNITQNMFSFNPNTVRTSLEDNFLEASVNKSGCDAVLCLNNGQFTVRENRVTTVDKYPKFYIVDASLWMYGSRSDSPKTKLFIHDIPAVYDRYKSIVSAEPVHTSNAFDAIFMDTCYTQQEHFDNNVFLRQGAGVGVLQNLTNVAYIENELAPNGTPFYRVKKNIYPAQQSNQPYINIGYAIPTALLREYGCVIEIDIKNTTQSARKLICSIIDNTGVKKSYYNTTYVASNVLPNYGIHRYHFYFHPELIGENEDYVYIRTIDTYADSDFLITLPTITRIGDKVPISSIPFYNENGIRNAGTSLEIPNYLETRHTGFRYFNTTLGKPVYWNGYAWVDGNGDYLFDNSGTLEDRLALTPIKGQQFKLTGGESDVYLVYGYHGWLKANDGAPWHDDSGTLNTMYDKYNYTLLTEQPSDWTTKYNTYYKIVNGVYTLLTTLETWAEDTYYKKDVNVYKGVQVKLTDDDIELYDKVVKWNGTKYIDVVNNVALKAGTPVVTFTTENNTTTATITSTSSGKIYYTKDSSTPTSSSTEYSSAITLADGDQVKAVCIRDYVDNSTIGFVKVSTPIIEFSNTGILTITCNTSDAKIYYTTDGSEPSTASTEYDSSASVTIAKGVTVNAFAVLIGRVDSEVANKKRS